MVHAGIITIGVIVSGLGLVICSLVVLSWVKDYRLRRKRHTLKSNTTKYILILLLGLVACKEKQTATKPGKRVYIPSGLYTGKELDSIIKNAPDTTFVGIYIEKIDAGTGGGTILPEGHHFIPPGEGSVDCNSRDTIDPFVYKNSGIAVEQYSKDAVINSGPYRKRRMKLVSSNNVDK